MDENPPMIALMPIDVAEICVAVEAHDTGNYCTVPRISKGLVVYGFCTVLLAGHRAVYLEDNLTSQINWFVFVIATRDMVGSSYACQW